MAGETRVEFTYREGLSDVLARLDRNGRTVVSVAPARFRQKGGDVLVSEYIVVSVGGAVRGSPALVDQDNPTPAELDAMSPEVRARYEPLT